MFNELFPGNSKDKFCFIYLFELEIIHYFDTGNEK